MSETNKKYFTAPQIKCSGKVWYVWFRYLNDNTDKMELVIKKGGANKASLLKKERLLELEALRQTLVIKLENQGWNPLNNSYPAKPSKTSEQIFIDEMQDMGLNKALDFALSKCDLAKKTKSGYRSTVGFFKLAAEQLDFDKTPVVQIRRQHFKLMLAQIKTDRKWSNNAYNKNLGYIGAVVDRLIEWEIIEDNPAHKIKLLRVAETQMYVPLTVAEKAVLSKQLPLINHRYYAYLMVIYHTGIRPKEVLSLKISDISTDSSVIMIYPNIESENSKTKSIRRIAVNTHLQSILRGLHLELYPKDYFVFGSPFPSGRGTTGSTKEGRGAMQQNYFVSSTVQIKRDTATKLWKKIVMDTLNIKKYQYALKHTGSDDKIVAGVPLDALKDMYGHSSKFMTEKYARKIKEIYKQQIVELSPDF